MPDQIFNNGLIVEFDASGWWQEDPQGDVGAEIHASGYFLSFKLGEPAAGSEGVEIEVYHGNFHGETAEERPEYLIQISLCGNIEFVFARSMWDAMELLNRYSPAITASLLTSQAEERFNHEEHMRKHHWDQYCFWCQHEKRVSE